jgi:hypothetical protein
MEFKNDYITQNFLSNTESTSLLNWVKTISNIQHSDNHHITEINKSLNGCSYMFDISKNDLTYKITTFQSGNNVINDDVPQIINDLINKITSLLNIPSKNIFLQVLHMNKGGKINPHYDMGLDGHITYKCNISLLSDKYTLFIDKESMIINQNDLYCFEASLYKHWTEKEFTSNNILLSFGFILPYSDLGRTEEDYRIRLSKRIVKHFQ